MPRLTIDLTKIEHNARLIAELLKPFGVRLCGVTKGCLGNEMVAGAMLDGGAAALADSRTENIRNLRHHFPRTSIEFLRSPVTPDQAGFDADIYFVSSCEQVQALVKLSPKWPLKVCLLIESGDGREGVPLDLASEEAQRITGISEAALVGVATNAACARADAPVGEALAAFNDASGRIAWRLGRGRGSQTSGPAETPQAGAAGKLKGLTAPMLPLISVGGSGLLRLLVDPEEPKEKPAGWSMSLFAGVSELRCGEAILLGRIPSGRAPDLYLQDARRDAFILEGPVQEVFEKDGVTQALIGFGVQDTGGGRLIPCHPGITPETATSDYFAVSCGSPELQAHPLRIGEPVRFIPSYYALLAAMTSPFVQKEFVNG